MRVRRERQREKDGITFVNILEYRVSPYKYPNGARGAARAHSRTPHTPCIGICSEGEGGRGMKRRGLRKETREENDTSPDIGEKDTGEQM